MRCNRYQKEDKQIKAGKTKAGSQKYKCKVCGKVYTPNPKERNYSEEVKKQAIKLYMEGNSGRAVGRILGISKNICLYWIKKYAKKIQLKNRTNERVEVIEMDELYSLVERKNKIYVITLVNREKRQIVGYDIAFDKSREKIQKLVDKSAKASKYYSDAYSAYAEVCYEGIHTSLKNKSQTYTVESVNSDLRHYIPPLRRNLNVSFVLSKLLKLFLRFLCTHLKNSLLQNFYTLISNLHSLFLILFKCIFWALL